jgi:hypothetical protein
MPQASMHLSGRIRRSRVAALLAVVLAGVACGNSNPTPTSPSTPAAITEMFRGTLQPNGSSFYAFTSQTDGDVSVTLASVREGSPLTVILDPTLDLGLGTPAGTGCALDTELETAPALSAQIVYGMKTGVHCVEVSDPGSLTGAVTFLIRIVYQ